jgi:hypothetical protein
MKFNYPVRDIKWVEMINNKRRTVCPERSRRKEFQRSFGYAQDDWDKGVQDDRDKGVQDDWDNGVQDD